MLCNLKLKKKDSLESGLNVLCTYINEMLVCQCDQGFEIKQLSSSMNKSDFKICEGNWIKLNQKKFSKNKTKKI